MILEVLAGAVIMAPVAVGTRRCAREWPDGERDEAERQRREEQGLKETEGFLRELEHRQSGDDRTAPSTP